MLIAICIIATISCILSIFLILQLQKNQQANLVTFKELTQKLNMIERTIPKQFGELSKEFKISSIEHYQQMLENQKQSNVELSNQVIQTLNETEKMISNQLKKDLHTYVNFDEFQQNEWSQLIHSQTNQRIKLQYLESALNKFPNNRQFFEEYLQLIKEILENATPQAKQTIIEKLNHASRIFFDNCKAEDANYAQKSKDDAIRLGHEFMKEMDQAQEKQLSNMIKRLEELVVSSKNNVGEIEKIDININKAILKNYPNLLQKYQQVTAKLTADLMEKPSEEKIKSYNLKAVESFRKAQTYFNNNEAAVKKGQSLTEVINYLGGWDLQYLSPPAQIYYQNVYSDIFSKLDADIKPQMTERILKASPKGM
ncbi:MAG: hypothetical protein M3Z34_08785 [Staphylococcus epidermidis]|nr:hypothetical protein [Staphylococcus epidermidis]